MRVDRDAEMLLRSFPRPTFLYPLSVYPLLYSFFRRCGKGMLTFDGDATFTRNEVRADESVEVGKGGAISNTGPGSILFKGKLTMEDNEAEVRPQQCRDPL